MCYVTYGTEILIPSYNRIKSCKFICKNCIWKFPFDPTRGIIVLKCSVIPGCFQLPGHTVQVFVKVATENTVVKIQRN